MKYIVSILVLLICFSSNAQQTGSLAVYGKIKYKKTILNEVRIEVYKDNELQQEIVNLRNGSFKLNLKIGSVYSVAFVKDNYIKKSVAVVAKADSSITISGKYFFQLDIELYKEEDDEVDETMLPPVAKLYIKNQSTGFTYDKKYVKWVAEKYKEENEQ